MPQLLAFSPPVLPLRGPKAAHASGVALLVLLGWASLGTFSALASDSVKVAHHHHRSLKLSRSFQTQSAAVAERTVRVMQTGTSDGQTEVSSSILDGSPGSAPVVTCPSAADSDAAWRALPEEVRRSAKPGECFARLLLAPRFETVMDHQLVQVARTETHIVPEVTQIVEKDVLISPEHTIQRPVAAVVHTIEDTEIVQPASTRDEIVPAQYETHLEHVLVTPERKEWVTSESFSTGAALVTPGDHQAVRYRSDGTLTWPGKNSESVPTSAETSDYLQQGSAQTIYCLKIVPAIYEDREVRVEIAPATTRRVEIPAVTRQVNRTIVDVPAHLEDVTIPAVFEKRNVKEVIQPQHVESVTIPALYRDVEKTRMVDPARPVWRQVLCRRNASPEKIAEIQKALTSKGYDTGTSSGDLNPRTVAAMQKFEADNHLPQGQISVEAVKLLGVDID